MEYGLHERKSGLFSFPVLSLMPVTISDRKGRSMMLSFRHNPLPGHVVSYPLLLLTQLKPTKICIMYTYLLHNKYTCIFNVYFI